ncbi:bombesin receptor subtype-3-like [Anneissia japonica]|uniref:bombesin receptor subtype-3-like n=1 Tax=Anneissia japonica TaxID=1529436 RepID=UPI001425881B|nr:bombesin receptor subtype-3-like [Anneissia japonica]
MDANNSQTEAEGWDGAKYKKLDILVAVVYVIIFIVGMFGNCSVFITIACKQGMRQATKAPNILLASLALSDCIYLLINTPVRLSEKLFEKNLGKTKFLCGFFTSIGVFSQGISVFSLVILSFDRYKAILSPLQHRRWQTTRTYYSTVFVSWSLAIAFAFGAGSLSEFERIQYKEIDMFWCHPLDSYSMQSKIFEISRAIFMFLFPMTIIAYCYVSISCHLCSTGRLIKNETENKKIKKQRVRLAAIIATMAVAFFICWFPYILYNLLHQFDRISETGATAAGYFTPLLACANSCINPVIIYLISREFRSYICGYKFGHQKTATPSVVGSSRFARSTIVSSWKFLTGGNSSRHIGKTQQFSMTTNGLLKPTTGAEPFA